MYLVYVINYSFGLWLVSMTKSIFIILSYFLFFIFGTTYKVEITPLLYPLLPPSLMVVSKKKLANTHLDCPPTSVNNLNHTSIEHQDPHGHTMPWTSVGQPHEKSNLSSTSGSSSSSVMDYYNKVAIEKQHILGWPNEHGNWPHWTEHAYEAKLQSQTQCNL